MATDIDRFMESIRERIHNKKWWTARWLDELSIKTDTDVDALSRAIIGSVFILCAFTSEARLICNSILIAIPMIFTFKYPKEAASKDEMIIYWSCFGVLSICDNVFENLPFYYDIKLLLALMMFVEPPKLVNTINMIISLKSAEEIRIFKKNELDALLRPNPQHSPPPEKPSDTGSSHKRHHHHHRRGDKRTSKRENQVPEGWEQMDKTQPRANTASEGEDTPADESVRSLQRSKEASAKDSLKSPVRTAKQSAEEETKETRGKIAKTESKKPMCRCKPGTVCECKDGQKDCKCLICQCLFDSTCNCKNGKQGCLCEPGKVCLCRPGSEGCMCQIDAICNCKPACLCDLGAACLCTGDKNECRCHICTCEPGTVCKCRGGMPMCKCNPTAMCSCKPGKEACSCKVGTVCKCKVLCFCEPFAVCSCKADKEGCSCRICTCRLGSICACKGGKPVCLCDPTKICDCNKEKIGCKCIPDMVCKCKFAEGDEQSDYGSKALPSNSETDVKGWQRNRGINPMETDDFYKIREGPGIANASLYPLVNIHEMLFAPRDKMVFNAPFDFDHVTYHMTVMNNTIHPIAFAIKANCIPRVTAYPAHGILKSKQKINVGITMKKFNHDIYGEKDLLVYEWVVLKDMVKEFKPVLLDTKGIVRRKTILIEYNG